MNESKMSEIASLAKH